MSVAETPSIDKLHRAELVAAAVERNRDIWVRMALRITANLHDAEDAVQEAISRVLTGPGNLHDADSAGRYLTRSVSHCAIDRVRARSRLTGFAEADEPGPRLAPVAPNQEARLVSREETALEREKLRRMLAELQTLPKHQREAVELLVLREPPLEAQGGRGTDRSTDIDAAQPSSIRPRQPAEITVGKGTLNPLSAQ